jgi:hypothetical protein
MDIPFSQCEHFGQIVHIEWIWFNKIDNLNLTFSQIIYYDLTFS